MSLAVRLGAVASVFAGAFIISPVSVGPVHAQGLFQNFFGAPPGYQRTDPWGAPPRRFRERRYAPRFGFGPFWGDQQPPTPPPTAHVSSPRYYTYEADPLKRISFAGLAEVETASNNPLDPREMASPFAAASTHLAEFGLRLLPEVGEALKTHYMRYPEFLWTDDGRVNAQAYSALAALERADRYGLSSRDYVVDLSAFDFNAASEEDRANALIDFELTMSGAVLTYVLDANRGRIDPNRISGYHDFTRKSVDLAGTLLKIAATEDAGTLLDAQNPDNAPFTALVAELDELRAAGETNHVEIAPGTFLKPNGSDPELANVVAAIRLMGSEALLADHAATLEAYDGAPDYTPDLVALVRDFQRERGLLADGIVGRNTIAALVPESNAGRIRKIELAMERLRWLPRDLGPRYVFINQPAFVATYMHAGRDPLSMRIVVGQRSNQTYFFMDKVEKVEYNPYWGVPRSIIVNEMLPKLYGDPTYLDRAGYEVTTSTGRRISSSSVDWAGVADNSVSVDVRQPPGARNALGRVKILFPNAHAIYMHDTPQRNLFERDVRAFSHGCVRLQRPREMAAAVLDQTVDYIDSRIAEGRNDSDDVTADIPVYVAYFTAWPDVDGTVHYYNDVYGRDDYLTRAIERTDTVRHAEG